MSSTPPAHLHLAVALDGTGWHPASWREPAARPRDLFTAGYWTDLITEAERGLLDFVTIEDGLGPQSDHPWAADERTDRVRGRLDAVLIASRVAPLTRHIGLVPTVVATHTEPFHISKAIATLDHISGGRAGLRVRITARQDEAAHFGRRTIRRIDSLGTPYAQEVITELFDEAADHVEVVRRLWDSWEDDAEIRDAATGRFIDRDKLHHIGFEGRFFSVKGPSITPRPPQGQPPVTALAHGTVPYRLLARQADIGYVTPHDTAQARAIVAEIRAEQQAAGRAGQTLHVFGDLLVLLDDSRAEAEARRDRLDALAGEPYTGDAPVFTGTARQLADVLEESAEQGLSGFRLRPAVAGHDLPRITRDLVPELQRRRRFRDAYGSGTLRGLLGLARPANRYSAAVA
ncbi:LLM class flavin-dependent oxidoreductase [Streptomyces actinomycinicus]|uniref:LLM class flavin-dependent oxidoreductase n=1 Tax=Streptomyces actinomycinicus TaxID=1695166 RepID=A0A937ESS7_9ACTN|nr:LLM class flavin-dependent oxidoreductase [Streptomyces actinomycinicus]MBL1087364.1 LLM class flavin-dependent oxidoreductase [Streptomyces actinomycinicus]